MRKLVEIVLASGSLVTIRKDVSKWCIDDDVLVVEFDNGNARCYPLCNIQSYLLGPKE